MQRIEKGRNGFSRSVPSSCAFCMRGGEKMLVRLMPSGHLTVVLPPDTQSDLFPFASCTLTVMVYVPASVKSMR